MQITWEHKVGTQLISLINKVTGLKYDMHLNAWCNTCSLFVNLWKYRTRLKNMLYLKSIECAHGCSVVDWLSLRIKPQPFSQRRIFLPLVGLKYAFRYNSESKT